MAYGESKLPLVFSLLCITLMRWFRTSCSISNSRVDWSLSRSCSLVLLEEVRGGITTFDDITDGFQPALRKKFGFERELEAERFDTVVAHRINYRVKRLCHEAACFQSIRFGLGMG